CGLAASRGCGAGGERGCPGGCSRPPPAKRRWHGIERSRGLVLGKSRQTRPQRKGAHMLTKEQVEQYYEEGYAVAWGVFTPSELNELEEEFHAIIERTRNANFALERT